jgi:hypothetical protein
MLDLDPRDRDDDRRDLDMQWVQVGRGSSSGRGDEDANNARIRETANAKHATAPQIPGTSLHHTSDCRGAKTASSCSTDETGTSSIVTMSGHCRPLVPFASCPSARRRMHARTVCAIYGMKDSSDLSR